MTKRSLSVASGVTELNSVCEMVRTPRPFICSKKLRLRTLRMKNTTSTGLMSVPVAIISTVTTMRGLKLLRNCVIRSSGLAPVVR